MGSIRTRSNGYLFFDFRYQGRRCRELTRLRDTKSNRKRLEQVLRRIEAEITLGTFRYGDYFPNSPRAAESSGRDQATPEDTARADEDPASPTFRDFAEQWFRQNAVAWKTSYQGKVRDILDGHLLPWAGDQPVTRISRSDVLDLRATLAEPTSTRRALSADRINQILAQLRQVLADAADEHDFNNPAAGIKPLRQTRPTVHPLSLEEVQQFLETVDPYYRDYFLVRFFSGLRTSEIDGLRWRYVDLEARQLHVKETLVRGEPSTTKTPDSERFVELSSPVVEALQRQRCKTGALPESYVFQAPNGGPLHYRNVSNRVWYPTLRRLGLQLRRPYQTRHTAATLWLAAGESPEWIARQMGHSDTKMLFSRYSRYVPNLTRRDGSAIERILASRFAPTSTIADGGSNESVS